MSEDSILRQYNIYISSSQRTSGTPSSFSIYLPQPITINQIIPSELRVFVDRAQIPFSFSQFSTSAKNTQSIFTVIRGPSTFPNLTFTIPQGNYNILTLAETFITFLKSTITTAIPGYNPDITFVYDGDANHLRFTLQDDGTPTAIVFDNTTFRGLNLALGFTQTWSIDSTLPYTESTQDINCSPSRAIYMTSTSLQQFQSFSAITTPFQTSSILTMIPIQTSPIMFISHNPNYVIKTTLTNTSISEIQITLRDEQMNELVEMDLDYSFHLVIHEHRINPIIQTLNRQQIIQDNTLPTINPEERVVMEEYRKEQEDALQKIRDKQQRRLEKFQAKLEKRKLLSNGMSKDE
jgi:hypothetical protein